MSGWETAWKDGVRGRACLGSYPEECNFWAATREEMDGHWNTGVHRKPDPLVEVTASLEDMLAAYKRQVEQEFARSLADLYLMVAGERRKQAEALPSTGYSIAMADLLRDEKAYREAAQSALVMADLPPLADPTDVI